jgi:hypothetical protein
MQKNAKRGASQFVPFTEHYLGHQVKGDELGGA